MELGSLLVHWTLHRVPWPWQAEVLPDQEKQWMILSTSTCMPTLSAQIIQESLTLIQTESPSLQHTSANLLDKRRLHRVHFSDIFWLILWENGGRHGGLVVSVRLQIEQSRFQPWPGTLCCDLGQDIQLSQCLSPPRCINRWWQI